MSVLSWIKLSVCLWLLRKAAKLTGWLLLAAAAVAAWPVTIVAAGGYVAAWLRGWPPARLRRDACYIHRGAATFVQVARPKASPLSLPAAQAPVVLPAPRPETAPAAGPATGPTAGPVPPSLDDILGPGAAR